MDQIRPIGPVERDIEPVFRVQRTTDERERPDPNERREQQQRRPAPPPPPDDEPPADGGSLIDVRV
jgi:hypothetical protein